MRERAARPRPARRRDVYTEADGLFGRITDLVIENPVRSGGFVMVAMVIGTIISNAAYFQTARHPSPLFATRQDGGEAASDAKPAPLPKSRAAAIAAETGADDPATLVADTQKALAALKLYDGPIDGKPGPQTRGAIVAFETKMGMATTGQPSTRLLEQLRKALPRTSGAASDVAPGDGTPADPTATGSVDPALSAARIRKVQTALNEIGYGPMRVDGKGGGTTEDAIRRFELDNGLALTGEANNALIAKLVLIGAMKAP